MDHDLEGDMIETRPIIDSLKKYLNTSFGQEIIFSILIRKTFI